jgi:hypothetical protein
VRVLLSPGATAAPGGRSAADALAGDEAHVVDLARSGVRNLKRRLSQAEIHSLRKALLGLGVGQETRRRDAEDTVVGYVCAGVALDGQESRGSEERSGGALQTGWVAAVTDHANLTWYSPLTGPNDDDLGPRFPVTAGLYDSGLVTERLSATEAIVAAVWDDSHLSPFEARMIAEGPSDGGPKFGATSAELASVAILAAHLGYRLAAAVTTARGL